ncbi:MAG: recD [Fibrobacteria bacterium]|jgi:exodeoxyribonuclease V alpha subunit|nr:recD [Fibrobacteria bacterium]
MSLPGPGGRTEALLARARERERIDAADARLIAWLCARGNLREDFPLACAAAALCQACSSGSLCLPLDAASLSEGLRDILGESEEDPEAVGRAFLAGLAAGEYAGVVGSARDPKPLILHAGRLFFHRHFHAEKTLADDLRARLKLPPRFDPARLDAILREAPALLTRRQKWALGAALRTRLFLLSGGPGTGKTTWIASWLGALLRLHALDPARVRLCAPTGRAAQRLQESLRASSDEAVTRVRVETLHTLLGYQPYNGNFARTAGDPLDADWVLLDEASMADAFLLAALVKALPPQAGLVLVGDADQLPSVEAGSALRELLPPRTGPRGGAAELPDETWDALEKWIPGEVPPATERPRPMGLPPSVTLDESRRAGGDILRLAARVNQGDAEEVLRVLGEPLSFPEGFADDAGVEKSVARLSAPGEDFAQGLPALAQAYAASVFLARRVQGRTYPEWLNAFRAAPEAGEEALLPLLWKFLASARILAPARRGPLSAERLNRLLGAALHPLFSPGLAAEAQGTAFHGAPVLITRNDARTGLANGESGMWLRGARGLQACFPRPDGWLRLPAPLVPGFEPGFASTVHKSQGSEYEQVLLVLPEAGNRLLVREILYTGITRAKTRVRVYASDAALREAVQRPLRRDSGLREWFTGAD